MRDSNYKSVTNNKAAVTITTSLYDRRALDVTLDKPLVNSLNHLTYLVSSLAKVRETLSMDGGIERLIEILHECHNLTFNLVDNIFNSEKKLLTAWKWTLAFQCLVLIGTRGTEKVRQRVVKAGMLPIIATVLDNYLTIHERLFIYANGQLHLYQAGVSQTGQSGQSQFHTHGHNHQIHQPHPQIQNPTFFQQNQLNRQTQVRPQQQFQQFQHPQNFQPPVPMPAPAVATTAATTTAPVAQPQQTFQQPLQHFQVPMQEFPDVMPVSIPELEPSIAPLVMPRSDFSLNNNNNNNNNININNSNNNNNNNNNNINININNNIATTTNFTNLENSNSIEAGTQATFFSGIQSQNLTNDDYENLSVEQLFKLIKINGLKEISGPQSSANGGRSDPLSITNDVRRRYLIVNVIQKLRREKENDVLDCPCYNECDYDMDCNLQFLSDMYLQEDQSNSYSNYINTKIAPRNFTETGVVIPKDDDIVWSLQLLAYISKYPYLKDELQNTHLVIDMSIRDKQVKLYLEKQLKTKLKKNFLIEARPKAKPKSRKSTKKRVSYVERFRLSASSSPQMLNDMKDLDEESNFGIDEYGKQDADESNVKVDSEVNPTTNGVGRGEGEREGKGEEVEEGRDEEREIGGEVEYDDDLDEQSSDSILLLGDYEDSSAINATDGRINTSTFASTVIDCGTCKDLTENLLQKLHNEILKAESTPNDLQRKVALFHAGDIINRTIEVERKQLSDAIINKRNEKLNYLTDRWDYDTYDNFDIDISTQEGDQDFDDSLVEYKRANLFPMVEKFTFLAGTDMYYWAGVIMRNSCRRNEAKGGVRQCGNLECGKWERYQKEFLKCRKCKRTKYCSRECQMHAWQGHRNWCIPSTSSSGGTATSNSTAVPTVLVLAQEPTRVDVMTRPPVEPN